MLARQLRVLVAFGLVMATASHVLTTLVLRTGVELYAVNLIAMSQRRLMISMVIGGFIGAFLLGAVVIVRDADLNGAALDRLTRLLCPVIVAPLFLALVRHDFGTEVEEAVLLAAFAVGLDQLLRVSFEAYERWPLRSPAISPGLIVRFGRLIRAGGRELFARPRVVFGVLAVLAIGHAIFMSVYAVWAHQRFATYGYDLGQYDQIFQSTLRGRPLAMPSLGAPEDWGDLVSHADLAVFYMLPIYAIYPHAETLLVLQAVLLASAALPLFVFASNRLPTWIAFVVGCAWLLYAPLHGAQLYDIHMQPFGAVWVIFTIAALDRKKWKLFWLFFTLAILCREDVSLGLAAMGLFLLLSGAHPKTGVAMMVVSSAYFVIIRFLFMRNPAFAGIYKDLLAPGDKMGFGSVIKTLISNPAYVGKTLITWEKVRYFFQIFGPLALLPLRRPALLLLGVPAFILTLLTTQYLPTVQISFQYVANWAAYMFPVTAVVLASYPNTAGGQRARRAGTLALLCASIIGTLQWGAYSFHPTVHGGFGDVPFQPPTAADRKREETLLELVKGLPKDARLCTSDRIQPHTTHHLNNWSLKDGLYDCEYLLWGDPWDLGSQRGMQAVGSGQYEVVEQRDGLTLAKKKPPPPAPQAP